MKVVHFYRLSCSTWPSYLVSPTFSSTSLDIGTWHFCSVKRRNLSKENLIPSTLRLNSYRGSTNRSHTCTSRSPNGRILGDGGITLRFISCFTFGSFCLSRLSFRLSTSIRSPPWVSQAPLWSWSSWSQQSVLSFAALSPISFLLWCRSSKYLW